MGSVWCASGMGEILPRRETHDAVGIPRPDRSRRHPIGRGDEVRGLLNRMLDTSRSGSLLAAHPLSHIIGLKLVRGPRGLRTRCFGAVRGAWV